MVRVRFAPSPTGPLHIGGVRTALYNYLFAKKMGGTFILRIEDTDQNRYVPGAEQYIVDSLNWLGLTPDESPEFGGDVGPYRQSERKDLYRQYAEQLLDSGHAYYSFDSDEDLKELRIEYESRKETFKYDFKTRKVLKNSISLSESEWKGKIANNEPYIIRLKIPENEEVHFEDIVRGDVSFQTAQLDDKVLLKADGMPTYHMANIVDDHLMKITHVIRGEEWLPSTPTHVLLYRFLGWEETMPQFCHLPLILKPTGNGKLSKRDGAKFGFPVFPLEWTEPGTEDTWAGFKEDGFLPEAVVNLLALLGWSPTDEAEMLSIDELIERFDLERINKSGARFDFDKAKWFNQQYIIQTSNSKLAELVAPVLKENGYTPDTNYLEQFCEILKERVESLNDFWSSGYYFFEDIKDFDLKNIRKRWSAERKANFVELRSELTALTKFDAANIEDLIKAFLDKHELRFGDIFPLLRIALAGTMSGPPVFEMMELMGKELCGKRLTSAIEDFDKLSEND